MYAQVKNQPSQGDLRKTVDKQYKKEMKGATEGNMRFRAANIMAFKRKQQRRAKPHLLDWKTNGHGWIDERKPDGVVRISFENWNSLKFWTEKNRDRVHTINDTRRRFGIDVMMGAETQVDWTAADDGDQFHDIFGFGEHRKSVAAHNRNELISRAQPGGTAAMAFGTFS